MKSASIVTLGTTAASCVSKSSLKPSEPKNPLEFELARNDDHLYVRVQAWNMSLKKKGRKKYLVPNCDCSNAFIVFNFPPQHYTEFAIPIEDEVSSQLTQKQDDLLAEIDIVAANESRLVFKIPDEIKKLRLSIESLLEWNRFEYISPDLEKLKDYGNTNKIRRHFIGFDWINDDELKNLSIIELPWGVYLQPLGSYGEDFAWRHLVNPKSVNGRTELWFSSLENVYGRHLPLNFEVLDVRGLKHKGHDPLMRATYYEDQLSYAANRKITECSPVTNFDRLEIAGSLSRRFGYTGVPAKAPDPSVNTDSLNYLVNDSTVKTNACYINGRTIEVQTFGISSLGGWLELDAKWKPEPGCALKSWSHTASFGRDHHVEFKRAGFLYPFGIPAELIILSEREFVKDVEGHYVAPLLKRAFIQIPQPNILELDHVETPFATLSITTVKTPPLDLPTSGNFIEYAMCDYFLPMVDGKPFEFEHLGVDHIANEFTSIMAMFFVSNKATNADGLINEPDFSSVIRDPGDIAEMGKPRFQGGIQSCAPFTSAPFDCEIDEDSCEKDKNTGKIIEETCSCKDSVCEQFGGDGLHELDTEWLIRPHRFAQYGTQPIALARPSNDGNTTQEVEWVEWVRGKQPEVRQEDGFVAQQPFIPRARTMKISLQGMTQFSAQKTYMLGTYRDLRFKDFQVLDPLPTEQDRYFENVFNELSECNQVGAYLHILPIEDIEKKEERKETNDLARLQFIRDIYYYSPTEIELPLTLFQNIENEVSFGKKTTTDSQGGISTPDSPIGILTREKGPLGDNVYDYKRWDEHDFDVPSHKIPDDRNFYISYVRSESLNVKLYHKKFDKRTYPLCSKQEKKIQAAAGLAVRKDVNPDKMAGFDGIASLFGMEAEILPGIRLTDILEFALVDLGGGGDHANNLLKAKGDSPRKTSQPPIWDYKVTGPDQILDMFGDGPRQISISEATELFSNETAIQEPREKLKFGVEASLDWSTDTLNEVDLGAILFKPKQTVFSVNASASIDILEGSPVVQASAEMTDFNIIVFKSLDVQFLRISFSLDINGNKKFQPQIGEITFTGALSFINNVKSFLSALEDYLGIKIDIKPRAITVSQVIALPPSENPNEEGGALQIGPVLISNLYIWWGIRIPLIGRGVLTVSFGLARREDPMSVYVPLYFGGKSHALMEVTTNGIRLFEVSIEFGGMIRVSYSIATGEVSLMAGTYFAIAKDKAENGKEIETFTLAAYVKVVGELVVAGFIEYHGLILLSLSYIKTSGGCQDGEKIAGEATISVSVKIGFVRYSYSFTAREEQQMRGGDNKCNDSSQARVLGQPITALLNSADVSAIEKNSCSNSCFKDSNYNEDLLDIDPTEDQVYLFSKPEMKCVWKEFINAYA